MVFWKELLGPKIRINVCKLKDEVLAEVYFAAQLVGTQVANTLVEGFPITPDLANRHTEAREVETVARAVARERTIGGGHHHLTESMRANPKKVNRHLGSKSHK